MRYFLLVPLSLVVAVLLALATGFLSIPDRYNPWAPLEVAEAPNFLTGYKLRRLRGDPQQCRATLEGSQIEFVPVPDRVNAEGCYFQDAVQVRRSGLSYGSGFVATCPLAVGLALFEAHVLQPEAQASFGREVTAIEHLGSYACRNVYNRESGRVSEHATANAFDIAAFRLGDGRRIVLRRDWEGDDAEAQFLRAVHRGACEIFRTVLGPDYNAAHADHFHLDMGRFSICR